MKDQGRTLLQKDGTKTVLASLLSIVIGLAVGKSPKMRNTHFRM